MEAIWAAVITGGLTLLGTIITIQQTSKKTTEAVATEIAVMRAEMASLCKEVEKHNNFAERIPRLEELERKNEKAVERLEAFHME